MDEKQIIENLPIMVPDMPDTVYNDTRQWQDFVRSSSTPSLEYGYNHFAKCAMIPTEFDNTIANIGNYYEAILCGDKKALSKFTVFDPAHRPFPDSNFNKKENKIWKADLITRYGSGLLQQTDVDFITKSVYFPEENAFFDRLKDGNSKLQTSFFWKDKETGLLLRARTDILRELEQNTILDVKTTKAATHYKFMRAINYDFNYLFQAQLQIAGYEACTGHKLDRYFWIGKSKAHPYNDFIIEYPRENIEKDKKGIFQKGLEYWARFKRDGLKNPDELIINLKK